ncbi:MAG: hypothetical protein WBO95_19900, partial [Candidatus Dechloromonas phosphoritropha]
RLHEPRVRSDAGGLEHRGECDAYPMQTRHAPAFEAAEVIRHLSQRERRKIGRCQLKAVRNEAIDDKTRGSRFPRATGVDR